jgi:hypothetical protein
MHNISNIKRELRRNFLLILLTMAIIRENVVENGKRLWAQSAQSLFPFDLYKAAIQTFAIGIF